MVTLLFLGLAPVMRAQTIKGFSSPESVNSDGKFLYVTNIGSDDAPKLKNGHGFISKLSLDGKVIARSITRVKLNGPKGTAVIKGVLYVADEERVVGIDLATGRRKAAISLAAYGTNLTNDLAVKDDHTLFVSTTDIGKIFEVDVITGKVKAIADIKGANGIWYDKASNRLFVCSFHFDDVKAGEIGVVSWQQGKPVYERIGNFRGAFDGLAQLDKHTLLVSDWGALDHAAGFIEKIDLRSGTAVKLDLPLLYGPADFFVDFTGKRLVVPVLKEGAVLINKQR